MVTNNLHDEKVAAPVTDQQQLQFSSSAASVPANFIQIDGGF